MKKIVLALAAASAAAGLPSAALADGLPRTPAYAVDSGGSIVRSGFGTCWRTGYWTAALAIAECDPDLVPKPVVVAPPPPPPAAPKPVVAEPLPPPPKPVVVEAPKPVAPPPPPPVVVTRAAVPIPVEAPKPPPPRKIALEGKTSFATGKSELAPAGKQQVDTEVIAKLAGFASIESITIEGHSDPMGTEKKNVELSKARAEAVKSYMVSRGVTADIRTEGKGSSEPVAGVDCSPKLSKSKLSACYEPLRRIEIDVKGVAR